MALLKENPFSNLYHLIYFHSLFKKLYFTLFFFWFAPKSILPAMVYCSRLIAVFANKKNEKKNEKSKPLEKLLFFVNKTLSNIKLIYKIEFKKITHTHIYTKKKYQE